MIMLNKFANIRVANLRFFFLLIFLSLSSTANSANVLYTQGHTFDTGRLNTFGGHTLGATFGNTNSD